MDSRIEVELPRDSAAPRTARKLLDERCAGLAEEELAVAKLLVSELINNALMHGKGRIVLRAELDGDRLRAEVIDEGGGFEHVVRERGIDEVGGHGLALVEHWSSRWGIHEGTTHVWFELERPGPRLGAD